MQNKLLFTVIMVLVATGCQRDPEEELLGRVDCRGERLFRLVAELPPEQKNKGGETEYLYDSLCRYVGHTIPFESRTFTGLLPFVVYRNAAGIITGYKTRDGAIDPMEDISFAVTYDSSTKRYLHKVRRRYVDLELVLDSTTFHYEGSRITRRTRYYWFTIQKRLVVNLQYRFKYDGSGNLESHELWSPLFGTDSLREQWLYKREYDDSVSPLYLGDEAIVLELDERSSPNNLTRISNLDTFRNEFKAAINIQYTYLPNRKPASAWIDNGQLQYRVRYEYQ